MNMADPALGAQSWGTGMNGAQAKMKAGVMAVTEAPTAAAARSLDKARQGYNQAIDSGRMAQALNNVTLDQWRQAYLTTGLSRISSGVTKGQSKYQQFAQSFYPVMNQVKQQVKTMPNNNLNDAAARAMVAWQAAKQWAGK